jgi:hypothetical protein
MEFGGHKFISWLWKKRANFEQMEFGGHKFISWLWKKRANFGDGDII